VIAFVATAIDYVTAQMTHPKAFAIVDQFPPPGSSGAVLAVCLVVMFQFGLLSQRAASNVDAADLSAERTGAWIVGAGLVVLSFLLAFTADIARGIARPAAWALQSADSIAVAMAMALFFYAISSMTTERRRRWGRA
jgi:hypothetical protein